MSTTKNVSSEPTKLSRYLPWLLLIGSIVALIAAFVITIEKLHILENPGYVVACDVNPVISCGSVMRSEQANAFGFPNPLIGLIGFPIVATFGAVLLAGAQLGRRAWLTIQSGLLFAVGFCHWLFYQAVYDINALCVYCIIVWVMTIAMFWYTLLYNLRVGYIRVPDKYQGISYFLQRHHLDILILWYVLLTLLILQHFWYYFGTLI